MHMCLRHPFRGDSTVLGRLTPGRTALPDARTHFECHQVGHSKTFEECEKRLPGVEACYVKPSASTGSRLRMSHEVGCQPTILIRACSRTQWRTFSTHIIFRGKPDLLGTFAATALFRDRRPSLRDRDRQVLRFLDDDALQALLLLLHPVEPGEREQEQHE